MANSGPNRQAVVAAELAHPDPPCVSGEEVGHIWANLGYNARWTAGSGWRERGEGRAGTEGRGGDIETARGGKVWAVQAKPNTHKT